MIIMGVDPGIASVGYGVVEFNGNKFKTLTYGTFHTPAKTKLESRLKLIHEFILETIEKYKVEVLSVEELFFNTNISTAISVGHGRGVILLAGAMKNIPVYEFTPLQVKQSVVGYGRAEKRQVQEMTRIILGLKDIPRPDDTADALALAICFAHTSQSSLFIKG